LLLAIIAAIAVAFYMTVTWREKLPTAYSIAVIGFPKSGKTTLITTLFGELFANRLGFQVIPRGLQTIERVNGNLANLELGKSVGPTTDQDVFAYRTDVIRGSFFKRRYKVEIGDFPGEDSREFSEKFGLLFHQTPYFKWAMEADAFLFIIDLAPALVTTEEYGTPQEYAAKMTQAIRTAWQRLSEYHYEGGRSLPKKPVVLVFTKADLFGISAEISDLPEVTKEVLKLGFDTIPTPTEIDSAKLKSGQEHTQKLFANLIQYLGNQSQNYHCLFVSCFSFEQGQRVGIKLLLDNILPK
jgi:GTPase SAR1 family protein